MFHYYISTHTRHKIQNLLLTTSHCFVIKTVDLPDFLGHGKTFMKGMFPKDKQMDRKLVGNTRTKSSYRRYLLKSSACPVRRSAGNSPWTTDVSHLHK